ncbi:MAG TPA: sulfite exporter TauE/SafE family protein [Verrucomicrobiota bacterium]|nr:sulfite exporter TauE/SafE family protein [Verrucomicrobiota bacterium]HNU52288.1 sulfite exporter TauE/SafE family protein [Verrucomicrobiota bacterium]
MKPCMVYVYAALIGALGGVTSGLFGVGGGVVMVPAMMLLLRMDIKTAVGTSLVVIVPTALMGAWKHHDLGHLQWRVAAALMPTAVLCGFGGAWLTKHIASADLKRLFGGFLVLVGLRLLLAR